LHTCWTAFFSNGLLIARAALIADHPTKRLNKVEFYRRFGADTIGNESPSKTSAGNQV